MLRFFAFLLLGLAAVPAAAQPAVVPPAGFTSDRIGVTVVGSGPDVVPIPGLSSEPAVWRSTIGHTQGN